MGFPGGVFAAAAWCLVVAAGALRSGGRPAGPSGTGLSQVELGLLRGGGRGAAQTGLVELYLAGAVEARFRQQVRRVEARLPPRGGSAVARAQYAALYRPLHPRRLHHHERVRGAIGETARRMERAGLLRSARRRWAVRGLLLPVFAAAPLEVVVAGRATAWMWLALLADVAAVKLGAGLRRTRRGTVLLARMRLGYAGVRAATERGDPGAVLLSVALFGAPALRAQLPRFTEEGGLLTRPPAEPMERSGRGGWHETPGGCGT
ncbi:TIGR04222 domain-containing membrane protein [Streptomyces sp. NPDC091268]|uniref:TIGR04222 domain-containing membrane protein n=1 Tax=Streptomyces sp. NPDC091268 TaxID=3365979 RepID=UPI00382BF7DB